MTIQVAAMWEQSRVYSAFVRDEASGQIIPELIIRFLMITAAGVSG